MTAIYQQTQISRRPLFVKSVGSFVPRLAQKAFEKYGFSTIALLTDWPAIAGPKLAAHTRPERLKWPRIVKARADVEEANIGRPGATLVLRVDPSRALDIQYGSADLIERINAYFGYNAVASIRILQAPVEPPKQQARTVTPTAKSTPAPSNEPSNDLNKQKVTGETPSQQRLIEALDRLQATFKDTAAA